MGNTRKKKTILSFLKFAYLSFTIIVVALLLRPLQNWIKDGKGGIGILSGIFMFV